MRVMRKVGPVDLSLLFGVCAHTQLALSLSAADTSVDGP
jgi:hypothetical protein